jgi:hypothetical protein
MFKAAFGPNDTIKTAVGSLVLTLHDKAIYEKINSPMNNNHPYRADSALFKIVMEKQLLQ